MITNKQMALTNTALVSVHYAFIIPAAAGRRGWGYSDQQFCVLSVHTCVCNFTVYTITWKILEWSAQIFWGHSQTLCQHEFASRFCGSTRSLAVGICACLSSTHVLFYMMSVSHLHTYSSLCRILAPNGGWHVFIDSLMECITVHSLSSNEVDLLCYST